MCRPDRAMRSLVAALLFLVWVLPAGAAGVPLAGREDIRAQLEGGRNYALLIGIAEFDDRAAWSALSGVDPEIASVSAALQAQHHFEVVPPFRGGRHTTKAELVESIQHFVRTYGKPGNRLVVYIASHGYRDVADANAKGYVVVSDTPSAGSSGFAQRAYSVDELERDLAGNEAQHLFLFVNTCFSGALQPITQTRGPAAPGGDAPMALSEDVASWVRSNLAREARVILTAGDGAQEVPDDGEYRRAVVEGLGGAADGNRDGLILGTELAAYVKGRVGPRGIAIGVPNDPVFASLSRSADNGARPGEFVFLSPQGPSAAATAGISLADEVLAARRSRLQPREFTECADCPVMVELPPAVDAAGMRTRIALARTETTFAEWDACYRDLGCSRYMQDDGRGRGDRPVAGLTWQDAREYSVWLNTKADGQCSAYDIPSRSQWLAGVGIAEPPAAADASAGAALAASAADSGGAICAGCAGGAADAAARTASLPANVLGLHDMQGNLWEWLRPDDDEDGCRMGEERCSEDGLVIGGSFATEAVALGNATLFGASMPRTGNRRPYSLPTVGLRMACMMR